MLARTALLWLNLRRNWFGSHSDIFSKIVKRAFERYLKQTNLTVTEVSDMIDWVYLFMKVGAVFIVFN